MEYLVGVLLSLAVAGSTTMLGLTRDRAFYPTVLIVVASYYVLFAVMGGSGRPLIIEIALASGFLLLAGVGFRINLWFAVGGLVGHAVFDSIHHLVVGNPGVPNFWPGFCLSFDGIFGGWLGVYLVRHPEFQKSR